MNMKNKTTVTIVSIVVLIVVVLVLSWIFPPTFMQNTGVNPQTQVHAFFQGATSTVEAVFQDNSVTFNEATLGTMTLPQVTSASGARYANADESLVFWNKGNDVTIYKNNAVVFQGTNTAAQNPDGTDVSGGGVGTPPDVLNPRTPKLPAGSPPPGDTAAVQTATWTWQKTTLGNGTSITPKKTGAFTLTLSSNGQATGKTDCNGYGGTYQLGSDGIISFGPMSSSLMFCEGSQEEVFHDQLSKVGHYRIDANGNLTLMLAGNGGTMIFIKS